MDALAQLEQEGIVAAEDGAAVLDEVVGWYRRFIVFSHSGAPSALALWATHGHAFEAAQCTPYPVITAPANESGKTRVEDVSRPIVARPWGPITEPSEAVLYRKIDKDCPTVLFDEYDAVFNKDREREGLRAIFNHGFRRGATVPRCHGQNMEVRDFSVFCPKMLAGVGRLPKSIETRKIPIELKRKRRDERVQRFREADPNLITEGQRLHNMLHAWAGEHLEELKAARPTLPDELTDRQQDVWEPLFAIADAAGGHWPETARQVAVSLYRDAEDAHSDGELLLEHSRDAFNSHDALSTKDLLGALIKRDDGPWAGLWARDVEDKRTRGPGAQLAKILKPFGISSKKIRFPDLGKALQGYEKADFQDAWIRYLGKTSLEDGTHGTDGTPQVGPTSTVPSVPSVPSSPGGGKPEHDEAIAAATSLLSAEPVDSRGRCQFCQQASAGLEDLGKLGMACEDCAERWRPEMQRWAAWNAGEGAAR
jgi:hypothetical protein